MTFEDLQNSGQSANTLGEFLSLVERLFVEHDLYFGHGTDNAWDEAVWLILHVLNLPFDLPRSALTQSLSQIDKAKCYPYIFRRIQERIPVAYLINNARFAGLDFYVDERVLIPRSPIGALIQAHFQPWIPIEKVHRILDIGTGCGCIAIAAAKAFPHALVDAIDISKEALAVTEKNVLTHNMSAQVKFFQSDLFSACGNERYDIIVANPPYVDAYDMAHLPPEYQHEPKLALAAGEDGLALVLPLLAKAQRHLTETGILILEVGNSETALQAALPNVPFIWLDFEEGEDGVALLTYDSFNEEGMWHA